MTESRQVKRARMRSILKESFSHYKQMRRDKMSERREMFEHPGKLPGFSDAFVKAVYKTEAERIVNKDNE
jgi:hypothetical protein